MRKTIIPAVTLPVTSDAEWLRLDTASVEVTSEEADHPIERALECHNAGGWRAATAGEQRIRIAFDEPVSLRRIQLCFIETTVERTHDFSLHWYDTSSNCRRIVRQQWNFSPAGSTMELEDYLVTLEGVAKIELTIQPGSDANAVATLECWRMA